MQIRDLSRLTHSPRARGGGTSHVVSFLRLRSSSSARRRRAILADARDLSTPGDSGFYVRCLRAGVDESRGFVTIESVLERHRTVLCRWNYGSSKSDLERSVDTSLETRITPAVGLGARRIRRLLSLSRRRRPTLCFRSLSKREVLEGAGWTAADFAQSVVRRDSRF